MRTHTKSVALLCFGMLTIVAFGCSSSTTSPAGGGDGGVAGNDSAASSGANCGTQTCDTSAQYCMLVSMTDTSGNVSWTPSTCKAVPSGCTLPGSGSDPSSFCTCVGMAISCPTSGTIMTQCAASNALIGFGCSN